MSTNTFENECFFEYSLPYSKRFSINIELTNITYSSYIYLQEAAKKMTKNDKKRKKMTKQKNILSFLLFDFRFYF